MSEQVFYMTSLLAHLDQTEKVGNWNLHALASDGPIHGAVHLANRMGAVRLLDVDNNLRVLNLAHEPIDHPRVVNLDTIEDSSEVSLVEAQAFLDRAHIKLKEMCIEDGFIVVSCRGGCNRSPAVLLYWLTRTMNISLANARKLILTNKTRAARVLKMKNRFQRNKDAFSWPTFYGGASAKLLSLCKIERRVSLRKGS